MIPPGEEGANTGTEEEAAAAAAAAEAAAGEGGEGGDGGAGGGAGAAGAGTGGGGAAGDEVPDFLEGTGLTSRTIPAALRPVYDKMHGGLQKAFTRAADARRAAEEAAAERGDYDELVEWQRNWNAVLAVPEVRAFLAQRGYLQDQGGGGGETRRLWDPATGQYVMVPASALGGGQAGRQANGEYMTRAEFAAAKGAEAAEAFANEVGVDRFVQSLPQIKRLTKQLEGSKMAPKARLIWAWKELGNPYPPKSPAPANGGRGAGAAGAGAQARGVDRGRGTGQGITPGKLPKEPMARMKAAAARADRDLGLSAE